MFLLAAKDVARRPETTGGRLVPLPGPQKVHLQVSNDGLLASVQNTSDVMTSTILGKVAFQSLRTHFFEVFVASGFCRLVCKLEDESGG